MITFSQKTEPVRISIDVGGTFTDVLLIDADGKRWHTKVRSTPDDSSQGVLDGLSKILNQAKVAAEEIKFLLHGTTVATNAILQRKGAKISLISTKGFEDLLEIGRQQRPQLYDLFFEKNEPLVPRDRIFSVKERILNDGTVSAPLTNYEAKRIAKNASKNAEAVAICLLFSYRNSVHEKMLLKQLKKQDFNKPVSISSSILPEYREYERMSTTALNAYVMPVLTHYLQRLELALAELGLAVPLLVMQSHGGVLQSKLAQHQAVRLLFSGLAGGVLGGRYTSQLLNLKEVITFDMGGTSTDIALITEGNIRETTEGQINGFPCRVPMVDVETVGAGGGSIAWIDEGNILRVGPQSAGADPGPVAYGSGGQEPTVTDANLLLGRLNPDYFLGGEISLHPDLAKISMQTLASRLSLSIEDCAYGIIRIVNANMERAIRVVSIQRGYDPRDFALIAFGGAGPMHAWALAKNLGIPKVIIPPAPGLHSALGLLATSLRTDQSQTVLESANAPNLKLIQRIYHNLETQLQEVLQAQRVPKGSISIQRLADLRYKGQAYEISIQTPKIRISKKWINELATTFHKQHAQQYGFASQTAPVTIVNLRVIAQSPMPPLKPTFIAPQEKRDLEVRQVRKVYFEEMESFVETPVYERLTLGYGAELQGPAIIEQPDSTTVVHPSTKATVSTGGNVVLEAIK